MAETLETRLYNTIKRNSNSSTVKRLIIDGVDCNLSHFDFQSLTFISPIQLATNTDRQCTLRLLYKHRNRPTQAQLEKRLIFYISQYDPSQVVKNVTLLEYIVSRLLHTDITKYSTKTFYILIVALYDFDYTERRGLDLCIGSRPHKFLQLRIFTLVQQIMKTHTDFPRLFNNEELIVIQNELLQNLETHYLFNTIASIPVDMTKELITQSFTEVKQTQPVLMQYYQCIATNVISKIKELELDQEYTIPTGWIEHAVCVSFRRVSQTYIHIRVDNPSPYYPPNAHRIDRVANNYSRIRPRVLGQLHVNDLNRNLAYFISLIDSIKRDLRQEEGAALIYDHDERIRNLDRRSFEDMPSFVEQANANCFVKCFEPGFRIRLGLTRNSLCERLMSLERDNANVLVGRCTDNYWRDRSDLPHRFTSLAKEDDGRNLSVAQTTRLLEQLRTSYHQHYQNISGILTGGNLNLLTERYVPLQFVRDNTPIELESFFIQTRVLALGDAGCGKTTVCQYATYSWASARIWQSKFEWLFYIKMRNLNLKLYPLQSKNYSLIDIIQRECFQGYTLTASDKLILAPQLAHSSNILWIQKVYIRVPKCWLGK